MLVRYSVHNNIEDKMTFPSPSSLFNSLNGVQWVDIYRLGVKFVGPLHLGLNKENLRYDDISLL